MKTNKEKATLSRQSVSRSQRLHTAIALLESAACTLERATTDGVSQLNPSVTRWCRSIRSTQQELFKQFNACESEIFHSGGCIHRSVVYGD